MSVSALPPMRVPTLTEVVEWSALPPPVVDEPARLSVPAASMPDTDDLPVLSETVLPQDWPKGKEDAELAPEHAPALAPIDEAELTQRVLADLQRQIDPLLEGRLQAALAPLLQRLTQALVQQASDELALTLRELVAEAVSRELTARRNSPDHAEPG